MNGWAIFYRHHGWYEFQSRVRCIRKPTNLTRIIVRVNIPSMNNAAVATIVADISYMSKVAEGTFICHEDPTCLAISCVDIWYAQTIFSSITIHYIRLKPGNQIIHPTLIFCGNGSYEPIYSTINWKFMHESVPEVPMLIFCGIYTHIICVCVNPLYSTENGNEESSREGKFNNQLYRSMWGNIFYCLGLVQWSEIYTLLSFCAKSALFGYVLQWQYKALQKDIKIYIIASLWLLIIWNLT